MRGSEVVGPPDESRCSRAALRQETHSCSPSCSGAETQREKNTVRQVLEDDKGEDDRVKGGKDL